MLHDDVKVVIARHMDIVVKVVRALMFIDDKLSFYAMTPWTS